MANRLIATWAAGGLVVGAVATGIVAATDAGHGGPHRLPIGAASDSSMRSSSAGGALAAATAEDSESTKIAVSEASASDAAMEPGFARMYRTEFEAADDLPALDDEATVWQLRRNAVKAAQVSDLAAVFSLSGDPVKAPDYDAWLVGSTDGTKPALSVDGGAGHHWYFSDPGAFPVAVDCVMAEPASTTPATEPTGDGKSVTIAAPDACPMPEPPANLPSADEALALAKTLADTLGLGSAELRWETFGDEWTAGATAVLMLDGVATEESWLQVSFGSDAKVQWASGLLDMPTKVADYPRIGTSAALDDLRSMSSGMGDVAVMPVTREVAADGSTSSDGPVYSDNPVNSDSPVTLDAPPVEEIVQIVKLTGVAATLSSYYGSDDVLYLVPSYRFTDADGGIWPVIALDDEYLAVGSDNTGGAGVDVSGGGSSGSSTGGAPAPDVRTEPAPATPTPETTVAIATK